jgi:hypothetical protein
MTKSDSAMATTAYCKLLNQYFIRFLTTHGLRVNVIKHDYMEVLLNLLNGGTRNEGTDVVYHI